MGEQNGYFTDYSFVGRVPCGAVYYNKNPRKQAGFPDEYA